MGTPSDSWTGVVSDGYGKTSVWMRRHADHLEELFAELGYVPYRGSLNLEVQPGIVQQVRRLPFVYGRHQTKQGAPERYYLITVNGYPCHTKTMRLAGPLDVVAPVKLRDHLGLRNGDVVTVSGR